MDWLTQFLAEQGVSGLLISAVVALASGFLSSWLTYRFVKRQELDDAAEREYNLEARKRLYHAIGPLRFQLVIACKDLATRIVNYGYDPRYSMTIGNYYGRNTLYRLIRPIAIAELIEQQITYADFSVDPAALGLLGFKRAAASALSDSETILDHPKANWSYQTEHLFSGTIGGLANSLIIQDEDASNKKRPMNFHEFEELIRKPKNLNLFEPLVTILDDFTITSKPIFWLRLICFGYICNEYVVSAGKAIGFESHPFDLDRFLSVSGDDFILSNIEKYKEVFHSLARTRL